MPNAGRDEKGRFVAGHKFKRMHALSKADLSLFIPFYRNFNSHRIMNDLAYVAGVMKGDGTLYLGRKGDYTVQLSAKDGDFVDSFARAISNILGRRYEKKRWRKLWRVRAYSKALYRYITGFDLSLIQTDEQKCSFLRGLFDSEGSIFLYSFKRYYKDHTYNCVSCIVTLTSTNKPLLEYVQKMLQDLGISNRTYERRPYTHMLRGREISSTKPCYDLRVFEKKSVLKFGELVGFNIKRKMNTLEKWVGEEKMLQR